MRILILANNDIGLYKFRKELIEELVKNNEVYMCLPNGEYIKELEKIGGRFIECKLLDRHGTNPIQDLKLMSWYKKIIKKLNPQIVFTYKIKPNIYGGIACSKNKIPYVVNITGLGSAVENPGILQKITVGLYKVALKNAKKVFFQNEENEKFMLNKGIVKSDYDLLPGSGVNIDKYVVTEYPNGETVDFVFVSRIMKEKGIDQYLDAAIEIRKRHPETRFHICGFCEEMYEEKLKTLNDNGTIIYHGLVKNMSEIYEKMSCTIHPTYYPEGLSNVLLESAASGRPIITTNRSGCREVVDNGINGYVVEEKNSKDLIEKIEMFLMKSVEERKAMGLAGRNKVEKDFNRQIVIKKYLGELKKV